MPYPANIAKLAFGGTLPRGDEWSMNLFIDAGPDGDLFDGNPLTGHEGIRAAISEALSAWFRRPASLISPNVRLLWVKCNRIGEDGRYVYPYTNEWLVSPGTNGVAGGSQGYQWQHISLAVTHRAREQRGAAVKGRTYPPSITLFPNPSGVADKTTLTAYANEYVTMLNAIAAAVPGDVAGIPLIVSTGTKAAPNVGTRRPIASVSVGDVIDVQQRRRNATPEEYTYATTSLSPGVPGGGAPGFEVPAG